MGNVIVWDLETVLDLQGFAAANDLVGKTDAEIREAIGSRFPKHVYHSIVCIGALIAHSESDKWSVDAIGAPHIGERTEKEIIQAFIDKIADCLLFLRHLTSIEIAREGKLVKHVARRNVDYRRVQLSFAPGERREGWYVIRADATKEAAPLRVKYPAIDRLSRQTDIQIAFNLSNFEKRFGKLFAYLPTEQLSSRSPFAERCLVFFVASLS